MGVCHYILALTVDDIDLIKEDYEKIYELVKLHKSDELDLYKEGNFVFNIVKNLGEWFGHEALKGFPYAGSINIENVVCINPEKVLEIAECLINVTDDQFNKAYAGSNKRHDYQYEEEGRESIHRHYFQPMIDFITNAAKRGEGLVYYFM
jgi:uncharacterized protein DUF1877